MKKILALSLIGVFGLPLTSLAATYHYLDVHGNVNSVEAQSAAQALNYVNSLPTTIHSGVALDQGILEPGQNYSQLYQYRTIYGTNAYVRAATLDAARLLATDKASNSGFYMVGE